MPTPSLHRVSMFAVLVLGATTASAADLSGTVFHDRNGNGQIEAGEEGVVAQLELYGRVDAGGTLDLTVATAIDGSFFVAPTEVSDGCYATRLTAPSGFRVSRARADCPGSSLGFPVGTRRYGAPQRVIDALRSGGLVHVGLGDSIAAPDSTCTIFPRDNADYLKRLRDRLQCIDPAVVHDNNAIGGHESFNLLEPAMTCGCRIIPPCDDGIGDGTRCNTIYDTLRLFSPDLITISIGGNDWLGSEPSNQSEPFDPADVQVSVDALISARANLQAILSYFASEAPDTDVIVNTVYDNRAPGCNSTDFHNIWIPIWDEMLRDVVWGHGDHFQIAEIKPEYASQDLNGTNCCGEQNRICGDGIHPTGPGSRIHLEKVWDAAGGVNLGPSDGLGMSSISGVDFALVEHVTTRFPTFAEDRGALVTNATLALARDDAGAIAPAAGAGGELVLSDFDATPDGIDPTFVVVAVRYRTDAPAPAADPFDGLVIDASIDGTFAAPQYTVTGWNTVVPIVGSGSSASSPNALRDVPNWREVRATLTKNLLDDGRLAGSYDFPRLTWNDIATLAVRLRWLTRGAVDARGVELDAAWVEVYGARDAICGNGVVEPGEECDDGNTLPDDGCSASCLLECAATGLSRVDELLAVNVAGTVDMSWQQDPAALGYHVNSVAAPGELVDPTLAGYGTLECDLLAPTVTCVDNAPISGPGVQFYQVLSICDAATEGPF